MDLSQKCQNRQKKVAVWPLFRYDVLGWKKRCSEVSFFAAENGVK